jgi:pyruvate/2-oxoglutarate dehydrogenase complex dihydrolipoamide dehydrogenase (E3) component
VSPRRTDVVVVGAGPAGLAAATEAARSGRSVTLVAEGPIGGRAIHASLLPSKLLLHLAEHRVRRGLRGLASASEMAELADAMERTIAHQEARASERLSDAGVARISGIARFSAPDALVVLRTDAEVELRFERAILTAGSVPSFPRGFFGDAPGPDGVEVLAPRFVRGLRSLPETMLVVGGGVTGAEAVSAFVDLGVQVTWLVDDLGILPRFDRALASSLGDVLMERGAKIVHGKAVTSVTRAARENAPRAERVLAKLDGGRTYAAERAFVAIGRTPDSARLDLAQAGIEIDPKTAAVRVDALGRTSNERVLAAGDLVGAPFTATKASAQAWAAARAATDRPVKAPNASAWIEAVYARPEIARVGRTPEECARRGEPFEVRVASFESSLRGVLEGAGFDHHARGTLKVVLDADERVVGATAIGPRASEVLAPIATAIHLGALAADLRGLVLAEPSLTAIALDALR